MAEEQRRRRRTDRASGSRAVRAKRKRTWLVPVLVLTALTLFVFADLRSAGFVTFDDPEYVTANPHVTAGLTGQGFIWALTSTDAANWHPLTWLSHMLDVSLFGMNAGAHHLMSVALHLAAAILLFLFLQRATGWTGRSLAVAAVFAVHPAHVESVAWIAERKDVLSGALAMATLLLYGRYAADPSARRYFATLGCFVLGLMAKPMLVTLPFILLLMDVWPLHRTAPDRRADGVPIRAPITPLLLEKMPFMVLAAVSSFVTVVAQHRGGAVIGLEALPWTERVANALVSVVKYLGMLIWPAHLAVFYPHPHQIPVWQVVGAALIVLGLSVFAIRTVRARPYLFVGWFWYLIMLAPVIGLVQVGAQGMADRYTYLPFTGLVLALVWTAGAFTDRVSTNLTAVGVAGVTLIVVVAIVARAQAATWHDTQTLWSDALESVPDNYRAHNALGVELAAQGHDDQALPHFEAAVRLEPDYADAQNNLGLALSRAGRMDDAIAHYQAALGLKPAFAEAHANLGMALLGRGSTADAIRELDMALQLKPDLKDGRTRLALAEHQRGLELARENHIAEAIPHFLAAVRSQPDFAEAHANLGAAYLTTGQLPQAIDELTTAVRINPNYDLARANLARALAAAGRRDK